MSTPGAAAAAWFWPFFWMACCFLVAAVLLGIVALVTLFRAPRSEATTVLGMFVEAFHLLAAHIPGVPRQQAKVGFDQNDRIRQCEHASRDTVRTEVRPR